MERNGRKDEEHGSGMECIGNEWKWMEIDYPRTALEIMEGKKWTRITGRKGMEWNGMAWTNNDLFTPQSGMEGMDWIIPGLECLDQMEDRRREGIKWN